MFIWSHNLIQKLALVECWKGCMGAWLAGWREGGRGRRRKEMRRKAMVVWVMSGGWRERWVEWRMSELSNERQAVQRWGEQIVADVTDGVDEWNETRNDWDDVWWVGQGMKASYWGLKRKSNEWSCDSTRKLQGKKSPGMDSVGRRIFKWVNGM